MKYQPDAPEDMHDLLIQKLSGPEPQFDPVINQFLRQGHADLKDQVRRGGLLNFTSLGSSVPWLYRFTFQTKGYTQNNDGEIKTVSRHVVALRFPPDFLRRSDQFQMLNLIEPTDAFHPNISPTGAICVQIYPGEPLVEICHSLHDLFRWRLRQYDESDALNPIACAWGRDNVSAPIDDRPLFG